MNTKPGFAHFHFLLMLAFSSVACHAIDNPDAPNYLEEFSAKASEYEQVVHQDAETTAEIAAAYRQYIGFLETELAEAESAVDPELTDTDRIKFKEAREAWRNYQKSEQEFIASVWQQERFGSSSGISRLAFYAHMLKARVELLQIYRMQF